MTLGLPPGSFHSVLGGQQTKDCQGLSMGTKVLFAVSALSRLSGTKHGHISTKNQNQAGPLKTVFYSEENGSLTGQGEARVWSNSDFPFILQGEAFWLLQKGQGSTKSRPGSVTFDREQCYPHRQRTSCLSMLSL